MEIIVFSNVKSIQSPINRIKNRHSYKIACVTRCYFFHFEKIIPNCKCNHMHGLKKLVNYLYFIFYKLLSIELLDLRVDQDLGVNLFERRPMRFIKAI